jgi:hypothetical protein
MPPQQAGAAGATAAPGREGSYPCDHATPVRVILFSFATGYSTSGWSIGTVAGMVGKFAIGILMIGWFLFATPW